MKIALLGYGKMGKAIEQIALERNHEIVLKVTSENAQTFDEKLLASADVAIEFTRPESVMHNINKCFTLNVPIVVGTTGWQHLLKDVKDLCQEKNQTLLYASNFSIGVNIFFELNKKLAELMNPHPQYNITMEEIHHTQKLDSPSGTAISLANDAISILERKSSWIEGTNGTAEQLQIKAVRTDNVPGTHIINYNSEIDSIEIKHTAHNRKGFAMGSVIAAEWLKGKKGMFTMQDVLKFN